jgi:hypothetical protein
MPSSVNGCGTGLFAASRKRKHEGRTQFDAIEALMFCYLPFVPYRALHVLDIQAVKDFTCKEQYQFVPLRMSFRLILKAFLNRWGTCLGLFGGLSLCVCLYANMTMQRPVVHSDWIFYMICAAIFGFGIACKIAWWLLTRKDEKIKDLMGFHVRGSSDPMDWQSDDADAVTQAILQHESSSSLVDAARRIMKTGDRSNAAFCLRLAMRDPYDMESPELLNRLLTEPTGE